MLLEVGQLIVELDLHLHRTKRLDTVSLIQQQEAGTAGLEDGLGCRVEHPVAYSAAQYPDDAPHAGFGAMFPAQSGRQRVFIEHGRALVGCRTRWRC